jgi:HSP20 family protein
LIYKTNCFHEEDGKVIRKARLSGIFLRSFNPRVSVTESDIKAKFNNGVLKLTVAKAEERAAQPKRIDVK